MRKLDSCPYCGEDASIMVQFSEDPPRWYVSCTHCGARIPECPSPEQAADFWTHSREVLLRTDALPTMREHYVAPICYKDGPYKDQYAIMCMVCGFRGGAAPTEDDAFTSWNAHPFYDDD